MDNNTPTPIEIIDGAIALIEQGWTQGTFVCSPIDQPLGTKCYCIMGAIYRAAGLNPTVDTCWNDGNFRQAVCTVALAIGLEEDATCVGEIVKWNDKPERTQEQVLNVLAKAKRELEILEGFDIAEDEFDRINPKLEVDRNKIINWIDYHDDKAVRIRAHELFRWLSHNLTHSIAEDVILVIEQDCGTDYETVKLVLDAETQQDEFDNTIAALSRIKGN